MPTVVQTVAASGVLARLRGELPALPTRARLVADVILTEPGAAARMQIHQLASRAGTSEASVTRLAQRLGCTGFPELRIALAAESAVSTPPRRVVGDVALDDPVAQVKSKMLADLEQSLRDTAAALDDDALEAVAAAIVSARRTLIVGVGASGIVATDLANKLERIGLLALPLTEYHQAATASVTVSQADVVIGVSHSGETVDVIDPLARAQDRGATTVALTSSPRSTLARTCDRLLRNVAGTENALRPAAMSSRAAQLYVVDVLFIAVVQRAGEQAAQHLAQSWNAVSGRHLDRRPATSRRRS